MSWWDKLSIAYVVQWSFAAKPVEKVLIRLLKPSGTFGLGAFLLSLSLSSFLWRSDWFGATSASGDLTLFFFRYPALVLGLVCG